MLKVNKNTSFFCCCVNAGDVIAVTLNTAGKSVGDVEYCDFQTWGLVTVESSSTLSGAAKTGIDSYVSPLYPILPAGH